MRRAAAPINGLLSVGRNRKIARCKSASFGTRRGCLDLAGDTPLMIRRLIVPLTAAVVTVHAGQALAQSAFPAPLPNQSAAPAGASPFPPVNGAAPSASVGAPSAFPSQGAAPVSSGFSGPPPHASRAGPRRRARLGGRPGSAGRQEGRQHLRYAERQRSRAMIPVR